MSEKEYQRRVEATTRVVLKPLASPLPLAFFAFGIGSVLQSMFQFGVIPAQEGKDLAFLIGGFVFPAQLLAGLLSFPSRETLGATAITLISFSWLATAVLLYLQPAGTSHALGVLYLLIALILTLVGCVALLGKPLLAAVIALATARYGLNGVYELTAAGGLQVVSGVIGCAIGIIAFYAGLAFGVEDVLHRTVLPIGRRGEARQAFESDLGEQVGPVETEAGVRKQL